MFKAQEKLIERIRHLRRTDGMRIPAEKRMERLVDMIADEPGGMQNLPHILTDMQSNGRESLFYKKSLTYAQIIERIPRKELDRD
jgi:hypothetical protein